MNPLLLFYLLGMFNEKDEDDNIDFDSDKIPRGFFIFGVIIFWMLVLFICWEVAKLL